MYTYMNFLNPLGQTYETSWRSYKMVESRFLYLTLDWRTSTKFCYNSDLDLLKSARICCLSALVTFKKYYNLNSFRLQIRVIFKLFIACKTDKIRSLYCCSLSNSGLLLVSSNGTQIIDKFWWEKFLESDSNDCISA